MQKMHDFRQTAMHCLRHIRHSHCDGLALTCSFHRPVQGLGQLVWHQEFCHLRLTHDAK
jgi:hypothetical protein